MADDKNSDASAEEEGSEKTGGKKSGLLWIGIAAGASVLSAAGTFFVVSSTIPQAPESAEPAAEHAEEADAADSASGGEHASESEDSHAASEAHESAGRSEHDTIARGSGAELSTIYQLETFVVNINDGNRDRFLKIRPELEISDPAVGEQLTQRMPQVKDIVISLLSSQSFGQIRSIEGKDALREDLMIRLNALVREGKVLRVFFTEFVVQ